MNFPKKSLGQNFLIEKNIVKKIINLTNLKNKDIVEIGPGKGALTDEIVKAKPKSITLIEKDYNLSKDLLNKYKLKKNIVILNQDILKFNFDKIKKKKLIVLGNLPYNISTKILTSFIKIEKLDKRFKQFIFLFQRIRRKNNRKISI